MSHAQNYLQGHNMKDPLVSPINADLTYVVHVTCTCTCACACDAFVYVNECMR